MAFVTHAAGNAAEKMPSSTGLLSGTKKWQQFSIGTPQKVLDLRKRASARNNAFVDEAG